MDSGTLRLALLLMLFFASGAIYSLIVFRFTNKGILRYLPSLAGIIVIPYLLYQMYFGNLEGFLPLAYLLFVFMIVSVVLGNVVSAVMMNLIRKRK